MLNRNYITYIPPDVIEIVQVCTNFVKVNPLSGLQHYMYIHLLLHDKIANVRMLFSNKKKATTVNKKLIITRTSLLC